MVSAWCNFLSKEKDSIKELCEDEGLSFMKQASVLWKTLSKEEQKKYSGPKTSSKPRKKSAWGIFRTVNKDKIKELAEKEGLTFMKQASAMWKALSKEEKKNFKE